MRYIRTKDGKVFDLEKIKNEIKSYSPQADYVFGSFTATEYGELKVPFLINGKNDAAVLDCDGDGFKESDSIEELLDAYSVVGDDGRPYQFYSLEKAKEGSHLSQPADTIYGCIHITLPNRAVRTEPVAKVNEKGGFDLL